MKHRVIIAALGIALAGIFTSVSFAARAPRSTAELIQEEQAAMVSECKPTDEQLKTLKEKFQAKQAALEGWDKANGEKHKAAEEAAKAARKGTDEAAKKKTGDDARMLSKQRKEVADEADKAIVAVLNGDQKVLWSAYTLCQTTLPRYKKSNLTEQQEAQIKSACAAAARDLAGFPGDDKKDKQGRATIQKALKWSIDNVILMPVKSEKPAARP